eukprot:3836994-Prymnesium_polylepis.1
MACATLGVAYRATSHGANRAFTATIPVTQWQEGAVIALRFGSRCPITVGEVIGTAAELLPAVGTGTVLLRTKHQARFSSAVLLNLQTLCPEGSKVKPDLECWLARSPALPLPPPPAPLASPHPPLFLQPPPAPVLRTIKSTSPPPPYPPPLPAPAIYSPPKSQPPPPPGPPPWPPAPPPPVCPLLAAGSYYTVRSRESGAHPGRHWSATLSIGHWHTGAAIDLGWRGGCDGIVSVTEL